MYIDFNRTCPDIEHPTEKHPLIGIEASGAGIKYRYSCGIDEIIQISGAGSQKLLEISDQLRAYEGKSLDILYEEFAKSYHATSSVKTAKTLDYRKKGELLFQGSREKVRKALCDDFKLCKKLQHVQGGITAFSPHANSNLERSSSVNRSSRIILSLTFFILT